MKVTFEPVELSTQLNQIVQLNSKIWHRVRCLLEYDDDFFTLLQESNRIAIDIQHEVLEQFLK